MKIKQIIALIITVYLCGCDVSLDSIDFTTKKPKICDITGVYILDASDISPKDYKNIPDSFIQLKKDGRFEFKNVPDCWNADWGESKHGFDTGSGTWNLEKHQNYWELNLKFKSCKNFNSTKRDNGLITNVVLVRDCKPYEIRLYYENGVLVYKQKIKKKLQQAESPNSDTAAAESE